MKALIGFLPSLYVLLALSFFETPTHAADSLLRPGRYAGYVYLKEVGFKLPTTLDTIYIPPSDGQEAKLAAYLKLSFGGFQSHEYVTHHYSIENYDWSSNEMAWDAVANNHSKDLTINAQVESNGERITGIVMSRRGGMKDAHIELLYVSPAWIEVGGQGQEHFENKKVYELFPDVPVYPLLTGSYESECAATRHLQFELTKFGPVTSASLVPMEGYTIRGRVYGASSIVDSDEQELVSTLNSFDDLLYNFYRGQIQFPRLSLGICQVTVDGIECADCYFKRLAEEKEFLDSFTKNQCGSTIREFPSSSAFVNEEEVTAKTETRELSGATYFGTLHYEQSNVVKPFSIDVNVTGRPQPNDPTIGARLLTFTPKIHIPDSQMEQQWLRFFPIDLPPLRIGESGSAKVLRGPGGDLVHIMKWGTRSMTGIFYSAMYGRVGTFHVERDGGASFANTSFKLPIPGVFLGPLQKIGEEGDDWVQTQLRLSWASSGSSDQPPHFIRANLRRQWNLPDPDYLKNTYRSEQSQNVRMDPFAGFLGADFTDSGGDGFSLFARLGEDHIMAVLSSNTLFIKPTKAYHEVKKFSFEQEFGEIDLLDEKLLAPGVMHIYMPEGSSLFINDVKMKDQHGYLYRSFSFPKLANPNGLYDYTMKAVFPTSKTVTHRFKIRAPEALKKPVIVNFFQMQRSPERGSPSETDTKN